jgi:hypothetical protein
MYIHTNVPSGNVSSFTATLLSAGPGGCNLKHSCRKLALMVNGTLRHVDQTLLASLMLFFNAILCSRIAFNNFSSHSGCCLSSYVLHDNSTAVESLPADKKVITTLLEMYR